MNAAGELKTQAKALATARRFSARQWLPWVAGSALAVGLLLALAAVTAL